MINIEKLYLIIEDYKKYFKIHWEKEKYKWEAIKHFQENWDINSPDFLTMFLEATKKTNNLLASMNNYPLTMIKYFSSQDVEKVRMMFKDLFDETEELEERIERFIKKSDEIFLEYNKDEWKQHYQGLNTITTYLWLRYPDKYYIYKYSEFLSVAEKLENHFIPKRNASINNVIEGFKMYDEICNILNKDVELIDLLKNSITDDCYEDKKLHTLTIDIGFFTSRFYFQKDEKWFPLDYSPNLSVDEWVKLLDDKEIFKEESLEIMKRIKNFGGIATCTQLANKYGENVNFYNNGSSSLGRRIAKKMDLKPCEDENIGKWWPILYTGKYADKNTEGVFMWKLREELNEALEKVDLSKIRLYSDKDLEIEENNFIMNTIIESNDKFTKEDFLNEVYMSENQFDILVGLLKNKKNVILQGAPGVGKTFTAKRLAYALMEEKDDSRIELIQFHQNYSYEDFIMGYKPQENGFKLTNGIFYEFCQKASNNPDKDYFFIIDEINRGNMSKIFGELLMLIEKDYRGVKATLAYSKSLFSVPKNLYIIGMMNTADRSLAMIDYALRRRFSFFEIKPGYNSVGFKAYQKNINNRYFDLLIEKIKELNEDIKEDDSLGNGFCIGHSYFCGQEVCTNEWLKQVISYDIIPMLKEYWFDDKEKLNKWVNELKGAFNDQ